MKKTIVVLFLSILSASLSLAQVPSVTRSISMGYTSVAGSTDIDALGLNPANIIKQRQGTNGKFYFSLYLMPVFKPAVIISLLIFTTVTLQQKIKY
jgi:hypothetical protein